jgi:hypothetical protein
MGEAPLWVGAAPAPVSLRMQTSWSKALGAPHQQRMKGLDRAHHSMHVQPLWCLMGAGDDFRLRNYGFTDLPPSLPLLWENPGRASQNQNVAGKPSHGCTRDSVTATTYVKVTRHAPVI